VEAVAEGGVTVDRMASMLRDVASRAGEPPETVGVLLFWLHAVSDLLIGLSYLAISATLLVLYWRIRRHLPFQWVIPAFGVFIVACGGTHVMHIVLEFGVPAFGLAALIQGLTLGASVATAVALPSLVPKVVALLDEARVSQARKHQLEASQSEKLRALGQLASGVAHDLNQSFGIIVGYSDLAAQVLDRPKLDLCSVRESLDLVARAAQDGGDTVKRMLAFARGGLDSEPETVAVGALLQEVAKLTAPSWRDAAQLEGRHIDLQVEGERDIAILGWPASLREALTNLVLNAVDALPDGGTIRLCARSLGEAIEIGVADSGVGIPLERQAKIFEPFYTTKGARGTGLGLAMVFGIVERHRGTIGVDSAPGRGTTFTLRLPAQHGPAASSHEEPDVGVRAKLRVLAVDDEPILVNLLAQLLRADGHTVTTAASADQALHRLADAGFDLVISDLGLGAGMTGWDIAEQVRAAHPSTPVILATGWGAEIDPDEARGRGVDAVIAKPFRVAQLRRLIAAVCSRQRRPVAVEAVASR
jgi:signal transduction histidine kinase/CheY-like chemotaxis protein